MRFDARVTAPNGAPKARPNRAARRRRSVAPRWRCRAARAGAGAWPTRNAARRAPASRSALRFRRRFSACDSTVSPSIESALVGADVILAGIVGIPVRIQLGSVHRVGRPPRCRRRVAIRREPERRRRRARSSPRNDGSPEPTSQRLPSSEPSAAIACGAAKNRVVTKRRPSTSSAVAATTSFCTARRHDRMRRAVVVQRFSARVEHGHAPSLRPGQCRCECVAHRLVQAAICESVHGGAGGSGPPRSRTHHRRDVLNQDRLVHRRRSCGTRRMRAAQSATPRGPQRRKARRPRRRGV